MEDLSVGKLSSCRLIDLVKKLDQEIFLLKKIGETTYEMIILLN